MIIVLRLGHRIGRDDRISTHCGLVSRALGADSIIYSGEQDEKMVEGIKEVSESFGGKFSASYDASWRAVIKKYKKKKFNIVHLTIYGMPLGKKIKKLRQSKNTLLIIGGEKVPGEVYQLSDYNISVSLQPHSEVAALAIFLHDFFRGKELDKKFAKSKITVIPQEKGKKVIEKFRKK